MNALIEKFHIKPNDTVLVLNAEQKFFKLFSHLPKGATLSQKTNGVFEVVVLCVRTKAELETFAPRGETSLRDGGIYWVAIPKKSSGQQTDLTMNKGWDIMEKLMLEIVASISIDETWSGFRFKQKGTPSETKETQSIRDIETYIDTKNRTIQLPPDVQNALTPHKKAMEFFDSLSFSNRKEYVVWIVGAKKTETRVQRISLMVEKLKKKLKNPSAA
ncbi:MAG: YdeI/OmpD-associated family protein [Bacteroidota bacterium]|nr:YdeI/OmpD-associated family protein [Bacteroidota bacterium]